MDWSAIIVAFLAGGVLNVFIGWLSNRKLTEAQAKTIMSEMYEKRITALTCRATSLEGRVEKLEGIIEGLRNEVEERDDMIDALQHENEALKRQVAELQAENECKDEKIAKLQTQVRDLTARLDELTKGANG